jgi:hypothetical protein
MGDDCLGDAPVNDGPIDAAITCAFAVHGRPGAYALLVGSGLSTAAGISTGAQIVTDLVRRIAALKNPDPEPDPDAWYRDQYGEPPTYSRLIEALGLTPADRHALIASFIEPDPEAGLRVPTDAHRAIARLVAGGWVRIIVTTNFDSLIEQALAEANVTFTVLATADAVHGALPLAHIGVVVIKLNGDRRDPRILNTDAELDTYAPEVDRLLDQLLDEYGLIICGWSAEHDVALGAAIERCPSRRFATFWTTRHDALTDRALALSTARGSEVLRITDADDFLGRLADGVRSLELADRPHPASIGAAVSTAKRELAGDHPAIGLHDTLRTEVERLRSLEFLRAPTFNGDSALHAVLLGKLESELQLVLALVATAAYWGSPDTDRFWLPDLERFAQPYRVGGTTALIDLPRLPALAMLWTAGVAAIAHDRQDLLDKLLRLARVRNQYSGDLEPLVHAVTPDLFNTVDAVQRLNAWIRPAFVDHLAVGRVAYLEALDRWQYILGVLDADARLVGKQRFTTFYPVILIDGWRDGATPVAEEWFRDELGRTRGGEHPVFAQLDEDPARVDAAITAFRESYLFFVNNKEGYLSGSIPTGVRYPGNDGLDA